MGTEIQIQQVDNLPAHVDPQTVASMMRSWPDLDKPRLMSREARDLTVSIINKISTPVAPKAISVKIVPMLTEYFVSLTQAGVAAQVGAIWQGELEGYPLWAIHNSIRWWLSRHNPDRRKKPLPGDISARCEVEMILVRIAQMKVDRFDEFGADEIPKPKCERGPITTEQRLDADRLVAGLGKSLRPQPLQSQNKTQDNINAARDQIEVEDHGIH